MNEKMVIRALADLPLGPLRYFQRVCSTNNEAIRWVENGAPDLSLIIADEQTAGRGRLKRSWFTPAGAALAISLILKPSRMEIIPSNDRAFPSFLTALGALAVADALQNGYSLEPKIKWPNDILVGRKKLAGVLVETIWYGGEFHAAVMGIGINVKTRSIPPGEILNTPATCVETAAGYKIDRLSLLKDVLMHIIAWRSRINSREFLRAWESRLALRGEWVKIIPEVQTLGHPARTGQVTGLDLDGSLVLRTQDGQLFQLHSGEYRIEPIQNGI
jgi:BirA family biotin operon repressor/biotin-[acetyl-CoA-carboxylase] ligase